MRVAGEGEEQLGDQQAPFLTRVELTLTQQQVFEAVLSFIVPSITERGFSLNVDSSMMVPLQVCPPKSDPDTPFMGHPPIKTILALLVLGSHESQSKPGTKMVNPEPCKELERRPQLCMAGIVPC